MRSIALALLLICPLAFGNTAGWRSDTSSVNLAATFPSTAQVQGLSNITSVVIDNQTTGEIEVNCSHGTTDKPSSNAPDSMYVDAGATMGSPDNISLGGKVCYVRSVSGTLSSGVIRISIFGW